jgi:integrase
MTEGRDLRAAARHAGLVKRAEAVLRDRLGWLLRFEPAPPDGVVQIRKVYRQLRDMVSTNEEGTAATDLLHEAVDDWNQRHPLKALPVPPAITPIRVEDHDWTPAKLNALRRWRPWGKALVSRLAAPGDPAPPASRAGVVLASAIRHGGLGDRLAIGALALWLADPGALLQTVEGLPLWIDLAARGPVEAGRGGAGEPAAGRRRRRGPRTLAMISGVDAAGPYALRRWFADPDTLGAIAAFFDSAPGPADLRAIRAAAGSLSGLAGLIGRGLDPGRALGEPLALRTFVEGAFADLELSSPLLDRATIAVARGRQPSFSPTLDSWALALGAAAVAEAAPPAPDLVSTRRFRARPVTEGEGDGDRVATRAFSALHAIMKTIDAKSGPDRTVREPGAKKKEVIRRLEEARESETWWTPAVCLLRDWYIAELDEIGATSVRRYHSAVAARFILCAGGLDLRDADEDELGELYAETILQDPRSQKERNELRKVLRRVHLFGEAQWGLSPVDEDIFGGDGAASRVKAVSLSAEAFRRARQMLREHPDLDPDAALAIEAIAILQRRCGVRIGEACKARQSDLEPDDDDPVLFIVPTRFGANKTPWARRQIRPFAFMPADEAEVFRTWIVRRRIMGAPDGPLFGVLRPGGAVAPFASGSLSGFVSSVLRASSGCAEMSDHALRHAAASDHHRAIVEVRDPEPHPLVDRDRLRARLSGWSAAEARRAAEAVAPATMLRDAWRALARQVGHSGPDVTSTSYVHGWDVVIFERAARRVEQADYDGLISRVASRVDRIETARDGDGPGPIPPRPPGSEEERPARILDAMRALERGERLPDVAAACRLEAAVVEAARDTARALSALRTKKGQLRLQPPDAEDPLAPPALRSDAERTDVLALMQELWSLRRTDRDDLVWWIASVLLTATPSNTGTRLTSPDGLRRWLGFVGRLKTERRWSVNLESPRDPGTLLEPWFAVTGDEVPLKRKTGIKSVIGVVRLTRPDLAETGFGKRWDNFASGAPQFGAHVLAIAMGLYPRDLSVALEENRSRVSETDPG